MKIINHKNIIQNLFKEKNEQRIINYCKIHNIDPDLNLQDRNNLPSMYYRDDHLLINAIHHNMEELIEFLLDQKANPYPYSYSILISLAYSKNKHIMKLILNSKINFSSSDNEQFFPLHIAIEKDNLFLTNQILKRGVDVNQKNTLEEYPLHKIQSINMLKLLLKYDPNLDVINKQRDTPLIYVARMKHRSDKNEMKEIFETLINNGANTTLKNQWGHDFTYYFNKYYIN